ncbi:hypothetical protein LTR85_009550 [Meristemomyces frigidus]|nr:hypothetical protein LTR85_009550 [Meristemomyces frigidus]
MAGIEIAGLALAFPVVLLGSRQRVGDLLDVLTFRNLRESLSYGRNKQLVKSYGLLRTLLLVWAFSDALEIIDRIRNDVLCDKKPDGCKRTRDAMCAKYNMTAVAAAIIAQVAITALSLDQIDSTHWTAQAAFIMSLVAGSLSVFYCCVIQMTFGALVHDEDVKDWLCKPGEWQGMEEELNVMSAFDEQMQYLKAGAKKNGPKDNLQKLTKRVLESSAPSQEALVELEQKMKSVAARLKMHAVVNFTTGDVGFTLPRAHSWKQMMRQDAGKDVEKNLDFAEKVKQVLAMRELSRNPEEELEHSEDHSSHRKESVDLAKEGLEHSSDLREGLEQPKEGLEQSLSPSVAVSAPSISSRQPPPSSTLASSATVGWSPGGIGARPKTPTKLTRKPGATPQKLGVQTGHVTEHDLEMRHSPDSAPPKVALAATSTFNRSQTGVGAQPKTPTILTRKPGAAPQKLAATLAQKSGVQIGHSKDQGAEKIHSPDPAPADGASACTSTISPSPTGVGAQPKYLQVD